MTDVERPNQNEKVREQSTKFEASFNISFKAMDNREQW